LDACKLYQDNSLDFVFIDASHEYQDVKEDIINWLPKVKIGGIIAGHDIGSPEVGKAVVEVLNKVSAAFEYDVWYFKKL
jgi:predicted O-methyltransferase YrrM